ncbi:MAG TPA: hypothetical protein VM715_03975 [Candidatus Acidoferrum sp.]|jgi:hypothetical protein|nr:hypothetical protein [Candidatus Acidoferrum sp.]
MAIQKTPHTQTQQNVDPEQSDFEAGQTPEESTSEAEQHMYDHMEGAETGTNRAPREVQTRSKSHDTKPQPVAYEGSLSTRTPDDPRQGITSHSAEEESSRQKKVVKDRSDAQAGVNRSGNPGRKRSA